MTLEYYSLHPQTVLRQESFGGLAFDCESWELHQLNQTGYNIAALLARQAADREGVYQHLSSIYGEINGPQKLSVDRFLGQLLNLGIVIKKGNKLSNEKISKSSENIADESKPEGTTRYLHAPVFVWWDITSVCNLKCKQCYSSSGKPLPDELTTDEAYDILRQLAKMKVFFIYFLGGEPFLRKDFLKILEYCRSLGIEVMISTNGWFITKKIAYELAQMGVRHVRVSIDGATPETHDAIRGVSGSFKKAIEAVKALKQAGVSTVGMSPTMMLDNIHEAEAIVDLAHNLGLDEIQLVQICAVGRGRKVPPLDTSGALKLKEIIARKTEEFGKELFISGAEGIWEKPYSKCVMEGKVMPGIMGCAAGRACLAISPNGKVRACLLYQYQVGDLRMYTFPKIWTDMGNSRIYQLRSIKQGCDGCKYAYLCSGPCPMQNLISPEQRKCFVTSEKSKEE